MKILLFVLLVTLSCRQLIDGYRILGVCPFQGKSHWFMMEELMKGVARRGHQVDVITHYSLKKPIPNYTEINIGGTLTKLMNNFNLKNISDFNDFSLVPIVSSIGTESCDLLGHPKLQDLLKKSQQNSTYDVVVISLLSAPCYLALGRYFKVPIIGMVTSDMYDWLNYASGNPTNPAYIHSYFSMSNERMNFKERLTNFFLTNIYTAQMNYYSEVQTQHVKTYLGIDVPRINDLHSDIALYLINSHYSIHGIKPMNLNMIEVAGLHITDRDDLLSPEIQKWLDESKDGFVYFSFGSLVRIDSFSEDVIRDIYSSFEKIAPVRVLMKIAKKEDLLPGLPKNVITSSWFSQISIFKHKNIRAFITHGGRLGTLEAIYYGIPMIGIPLFSDQYHNTKNLINKKVAISLDLKNINEETLTSALNNILKDPSYRNNMKRLSKLFVDRPMNPLDTSIYWVEYVAKHKNTLPSPALHLHWWQRYLLDVYAFIVAVIVTVLYVARFILRKLKSYLSRLYACVNKTNGFINGVPAITSKKEK